MKPLFMLQRLAMVLSLLVLVGCASTQKQPYDYLAFKESHPRSILVLPPVNNTPELRASYSMLAQVTHPLAESGYYVVPVTLVDETLRENGISQAADAHALPVNKLREIFAADAVLYLTMTQYGTQFKVLDSVTTVAADGVLKDLRTDRVIWTGSARASSAEQQNQQQGGLAVALISALVKQVVGTATDQSHPMAGVVSQRLLKAGRPDGLLYGPRSPKYQSD